MRNLFLQKAFLQTGWLLLALLPFSPVSCAETAPQAQLFIQRQPTQIEIARRDTHGKFEPAVGCYLGAFIDFDGSLHRPIRQDGAVHQDPAGFESIVQRAHSMYFFYLGYGRPLPLQWVQWLGAHGKFVHIALEPNAGMKQVKDDAYLQKLADDMARSKAKIFLRFASEMNGKWSVYSKDPALYRNKFRLVHAVMKRRAPNVALVWCPYTTPKTHITEYYPGDDAVDWVGVNLYNVTYHDNNPALSAESEHPCDLVQYVYNRYAAHKPMMICEYAATHYAACENRQRAEFAYRKILTLYTALPRLYPRIKCINYFDGNNLQFASDRAYNDYSVTDSPLVTGAYRIAVSEPYFLDKPLMQSRDANAAVIPMPMRQGELLKGSVRISCWARTPADIVTVRYKIDGALIYQTSRPDQWECVWNAGSVKPGRHLITLEAIRPQDKKVVASQSLHIVTSK